MNESERKCPALRLDLVSSSGMARPISFAVRRLIVAGWAGRDQAAVRAHIEELATLGVARPSEMPCFYRVAVNQVTQSDRLEVLGDHTSGEVEFVLLRHEGDLWVGVGSDHTDRAMEAQSVAASKQVCAKSIAPTLWRFSELAAHWDRLVIRSWLTRDGIRRSYQDGSTSSLLRPEDLLRRLDAAGIVHGEGTVIYGGTCPVIGEIEGGARFEYQFEDPVLGRAIRYGYDLVELPVIR